MKVGDLVTTVECAQEVDYEITNLGIVIDLVKRAGADREGRVMWVYTVGPVFEYYPLRWLRIVNEN
jgi:hypothetical protein